MADIQALIERVEKAKANDRELFEDAFRLVFPKPDRIWVTDSRGDWTIEYSRWQALQNKFYEFLEAAAFLDAAMSLVPEGATWRVDSLASRHGQGALGSALVLHPPGVKHNGDAATPALALLAAILRARKDR